MCSLRAPRRRRLYLVIWHIAAGFVLATAPAIHAPPARAGAVAVTVGGPFTLTAPDGTTVTDATYRGKWLLLLFGYTSCPDLCPTALNEVAATLEKLGPDAARVQALFVTVDPERDTPVALGKYTASFDSRIVGLTGSRQQIAAVTQAYGAYTERHTTGAGEDNYVVDHSTYIYIVDPRGKFARGLDFGTPSGRIVEIMSKLMLHSNKQ